LLLAEMSQAPINAWSAASAMIGRQGHARGARTNGCCARH